MADLARDAQFERKREPFWTIVRLSRVDGLKTLRGLQRVVGDFVEESGYGVSVLGRGYLEDFFEKDFAGGDPDQLAFTDEHSDEESGEKSDSGDASTGGESTGGESTGGESSDESKEGGSDA